MAKIKRLIIPSIDEDIEQLKFSSIVGGNEMVQPLWKTVWQGLKIKVTICSSYDSEIPFLCTYSGKWKYMFTELYLNDYRSFTHNSPKLETTQMSINRWTDEQIVVYHNNGILLSNERNVLIHTKCLNYIEWKEPGTTTTPQKKVSTVWFHLYKTPENTN